MNFELLSSFLEGTAQLEFISAKITQTADGSVLKNESTKKKYRFRIEFNVTNTRIYFYVNSIMEFAGISNLEFDGLLDNGDKIFCKNLYLINNTYKYCVFSPINDIIIGEPNIEFIESAIFPIHGLYTQDINFEFNGFKITSNENSADGIEIYEKLNIQIAGINLCISKPNTNFSEFNAIAEDICVLLSLTLGREMYFNKIEYITDNNNKSTVYKTNKAFSSSIGQILSDANLNIFLKQSLLIYSQMSKDDKKAVKISINYLNLSNDAGYLEDHLLRVVQAWEALAVKWVSEEYVLPAEVNSLKKLLKETINKWKDDNPSITKEEKNTYSQRISDALKWKKAIFYLETLVSNEKLNLTKIPVEFAKLTSARNDIAHTGAFSEKNNAQDIINLLEPAIINLRILLLNKLNYKGEIHFENMPVNISEFILS